jgi:hypothetical protein
MPTRIGHFKGVIDAANPQFNQPTVQLAIDGEAPLRTLILCLRRQCLMQ